VAKRKPFLCRLGFHKWREVGQVSLTMVGYKCWRCGAKGSSHVADEGDIYECEESE